jgi:hypothetical protein
VIVDVAPIAVLDAVTADKTTSDMSLGFRPDASVRNTLCTLAADAAGVACADVNVMKSNLEPLVPAVNKSTRDPDPSRAVFAAAIVAVGVFGTSVNMGFVFAGIIMD